MLFNINPVTHSIVMMRPEVRAQWGTQAAVRHAYAEALRCGARERHSIAYRPRDSEFLGLIFIL